MRRGLQYVFTGTCIAVRAAMHVSGWEACCSAGSQEYVLQYVLQCVLQCVFIGMHVAVRVAVRLPGCVLQCALQCGLQCVLQHMLHCAAVFCSF